MDINVDISLYLSNTCIYKEVYYRGLPCNCWAWLCKFKVHRSGVQEKKITIRLEPYGHWLNFLSKCFSLEGRSRVRESNRKDSRIWSHSIQKGPKPSFKGLTLIR